MAKKLYCMGIRLDSNYKEVTCQTRDKCPIYRGTNLSEALSLPDFFEQADVYNSEPCKYYKG